MNHRMTCLLAILLLINTARTGSVAAPGEQRPQVRGELPEGWNAPDPGAGAVPSAYEVGVDRAVKHGGEASAAFGQLLCLRMVFGAGAVSSRTALQAPQAKVTSGRARLPITRVSGFRSRAAAAR